MPPAGDNPARVRHALRLGPPAGEGNDDAYRQIAEKAAVAQSESALGLSSIQAALADVAARLAAIEKVLKEVE
jgi:hypothetical protein